MDPEEYLTRWLREDRDRYRKQGLPDGYYYAGISDFVLQYGVWYAPVPFPVGIRKGRNRHCFRNAAAVRVVETAWRAPWPSFRLSSSAKNFSR